MFVKNENLRLPATDGFQLVATRYLPSSPNGNALIINSALGVKRTFYNRFASFLAEKGFIVITFDYRGIGDSRPATLNKFTAFLRDWGERDFAGVISWVSSEYPDAGIFAIGHSIGGQVAGLAENIHQLSAMIFIASQNGYWGLWPWPQRYLLGVAFYLFVPLLTALVSFFPARCFSLGENLPAGVAFEWASWGREPDYFFSKTNLISKHNIKKYSKPILLFSFADDAFAPKRAVDSLAQFYENAKVERRHLATGELSVRRLGHFDFFRESFSATLWSECEKWLHENLHRVSSK